VTNLRIDRFDSHGKERLNGIFDLRLAGSDVHFEAIGIVPSALMRAFFGDQRAKDDLVRLEIESGRADARAFRLAI
jgi:hypothetical protein